MSSGLLFYSVSQAVSPNSQYLVTLFLFERMVSKDTRILYLPSYPPKIRRVPRIAEVHPPADTAAPGTPPPPPPPPPLSPPRRPPAAGPAPAARRRRRRPSLGWCRPATRAP